jgi:hypothetical protein
MDTGSIKYVMMCASRKGSKLTNKEKGIVESFYNARKRKSSIIVIGDEVKSYKTIKEFNDNNGYNN